MAMNQDSNQRATDPSATPAPERDVAPRAYDHGSGLLVPLDPSSDHAVTPHGGGPFVDLPAEAPYGDLAPTVQAEPAAADVMTETIRRWARPTTVEELKKRGVRRLHSVSMTRLAGLLEKAVNRALIERTLGGDADEALSLSATARDEFMRLTTADARGKLGRDDRTSGAIEGAEDDTGHSKERWSEETLPLRERATSTLDRLRRELEGRRKVLADRERQLSDGDLDAEEDARLSDQMRELFAVHAGVDDRALEKAVLGLVAGELRTSRRRARLARLEEHQREIGTLERRIAKLSVLLGETEDALRRIRAGREVDDGVSSIYDEVQGLGRDDEMFEQKSELMKTLFEANLALKR